ncbi:MAG: hypothetical protein ACP5P9_10860 [Acidimicrobiales bacterium]
MKIRSRGLGRRELEMDLREFTVERDGTGVLLKGVTHAPITWETTVWVGPRDVGTILRMAAHLSMLRLGMAWVLRRPDVPADDRTGERMGRVPAAATPAAATPAAGAVVDGPATLGDSTATGEPSRPTTIGDAGRLGPTDGAGTAPAPPAALPTAPPSPLAAAPRPRPPRLVRAERASRPPRPPRPPRAPRPPRPERPGPSAATGPERAEDTASATNGKEA